MNPRLWRRISILWNRIPGQSGGFGKVFDGDIQAEARSSYDLSNN
jgi:hypothetical protein